MQHRAPPCGARSRYSRWTPSSVFRGTGAHSLPPPPSVLRVSQRWHLLHTTQAVPWRRRTRGGPTGKLSNTSLARGASCRTMWCTWLNPPGPLPRRKPPPSGVFGLLTNPLARFAADPEIAAISSVAPGLQPPQLPSSARRSSSSCSAISKAGGWAFIHVAGDAFAGVGPQLHHLVYKLTRTCGDPRRLPARSSDRRPPG